MVDDPAEQAYAEGFREGKRRTVVIGTVLSVVVAILLLFGVAASAYLAGMRHGTSGVIAAEFVQRAIKYGYEQGARDALNGTVTAQ